MRRLSLLAAVAVANAAWPGGASALDSRTLDSEGVGYRVVTIQPARERLELRWKDRDGNAIASIERLREGAKALGGRLLFATNAGIYDREFRPLGLHVEAGRTLRALNPVQGNAASGNFSLPPNGVFWIDREGKAGVTTTADWREHPRDAWIASQSGPMLVIGGMLNPRFDAASDSLKWRSGVCAPTPDSAVFVVSLAPVSFHAFATVFRDRLNCSDALFLDGTLSQIWTERDGYSGAPPFMVKPYVGLFAVFARDQDEP